MKFEPNGRVLEFASEEEVLRFHTELTALLRDVVANASHHGDRDEGKAASKEVFKEFATILRALNALRRHLEPSSRD